MPYIVTKTIKGKRYLYLQSTYRANGRVKTISEYIGPEEDSPYTVTPPPRPPGPFMSGLIATIAFIGFQFPRTHGLDWDKFEQDELERQEREAEKEREFAEKMRIAYGMNLKTYDEPKIVAARPVDLSAIPRMDDLEEDDALPSEETEALEEGLDLSPADLAEPEDDVPESEPAPPSQPDDAPQMPDQPSEHQGDASQGSETGTPDADAPDADPASL